MNKWKVEYLPAALQDRKRLDGSVRKTVDKAIDKVSTNPLPVDEGGYGKPLGNHNDSDLNGLFKIKFRDLGLRVVYKTEMVDSRMKIIVVSARSDDQVYREAARRRTK